MRGRKGENVPRYTSGIYARSFDHEDNRLRERSKRGGVRSIDGGDPGAGHLGVVIDRHGFKRPKDNGHVWGLNTLFGVRTSHNVRIEIACRDAEMMLGFGGRLFFAVWLAARGD